MGCFLGCFGGAKSKERRHRRRKRSPAQSPNARARHSPRKADFHADAVSAAAPLLSTLLELRDSADDMCLTIVKKKVTFDSTVTAYEAPAIPEEEEEEVADPGLAAGGGGKDEEESWMLGPECAKSEAFPLNHRYGNCAGADDDDSDYEEEYYSDEYDDGEYEDEEEDGDGIDAIDDDEEQGGLLGIARGEEEACESLFLLPVTKPKEGAGQQEPAAPPPCPTRERSQCGSGNPVLNSVEDFTQWKDDKSGSRTAAAPKNSDKENFVALGQENWPSSNKLSDPAPIPSKKKDMPVVSSDYTPSTPSKQEASVDASLSTWLGSTGTPESNSVRSYSPISREDRPILGALTMEDIKISSANSTPMRSRSPSPSPDDMPILGTVGAYWNCSAKGAKGGDDSVTRGGFMKTRSRFGQNFA
uniref:Uncharacterized protein n=1 Tax=Avena sativa TaxID=4498 RepID=A0ACD5WS43_AVESA